MKKEYNKLVRDKLPVILNRKGIKHECHVAQSRDEAVRMILAKVHEEATELEQAITNPAGWTDNIVAEEFADLYEVLDVLTVITGIDADRIGEVAAKKKETNGAFEKLLILDWTEENTHSTK